MLINCKDTLAARLGTTAHISALLIKAQRVGLSSVRELSSLGVLRGCKQYAQDGDPAVELLSQDKFSDEELTLSLLNIALPYDKRCILIGAAMLGTPTNSLEDVLRLAKWERSEPVVRYIAECGHRFEPDNPFWNTLLDRLPSVGVKSGILPIPSELLTHSPEDSQSATRGQWIRSTASPARSN